MKPRICDLTALTSRYAVCPHHSDRPCRAVSSNQPGVLFSCQVDGCTYSTLVPWHDVDQPENAYVFQPLYISQPAFSGCLR